jgi:toxin FitB
MKYLLDTNIISELKRKKPNQEVMDWFGEINTEDLYLSCITIGELKSGALKKAKTDVKTGKLLIKWIDGLVADYEEQILNIDLETCKIWAQLLNIDSTNAIDGLIAAQCLQSNMVLVTRNIKHFKMFDMKLFNPFDRE